MASFASISSVILFAISIITFVASLIEKAQNDGKILARIDQMQSDIVEIKTTLKEKGQGIEDIRVITERQEQQIYHLEQEQLRLEERLHQLESGGQINGK